jgi:hypothetical protein
MATAVYVRYKVFPNEIQPHDGDLTLNRKLRALRKVTDKESNRSASPYPPASLHLA